jgi:poly(A) polymerase
MSKSFAISILRTLRDRGHQAYFVGGCVRDLLLGREPADYDVATDATPGEVMRIFPETYAVGAQFGVVLVPVPEIQNKPVIPSEVGVSRSENPVQPRACPERTDQREEVEGGLLFAGSEVNLKAHNVEVATFRSDIGYSDGRHPDQVRFSRDAREDVQRRDFTINGLLLDPLNGEVLDYVGGQKDLQAKIIRAIGDPALCRRQVADVASRAFCSALRIRH